MDNDNPDANKVNVDESSDSVSEALLKHIFNRPQRNTLSKVYKNYKHMCNIESSSDGEQKSTKCIKPLPGALPSQSRLRAQALISKHLIKNTSASETDSVHP